jgi:hypothetical protein
MLRYKANVIHNIYGIKTCWSQLRIRYMVNIIIKNMLTDDTQYRFLSKNNVGQIKFNIICMTKTVKHIPRNLIPEYINNPYNIGHTVLKTIGGGVNLDLISLSYEDIYYKKNH